VKVLSLLALCLVFFSTCKKLEKPKIDNESQSCQDAAIADQEFSGLVAHLFRHIFITPAAVDYIKGFKAPLLKFEGGDTINFLQPAVFSLDAAQLGGLAGDGKVRSGIIRVELSQPFDRQGAVSRIHLVNYEADGVRFGAETFTLTTISESGKYFALDLGLNKGFCSAGSQEFSFSAKRRLSLFFEGGVYGSEPYMTLYGTGTGTSRKGLSYTIEVLTDVLKYNACPYFSAGKVQVSPFGYKERAVDFGGGDCDNLAHYTVLENKVAFKLK